MAMDGLEGPVLVTVAYVLVYYGTTIHILRTKGRLRAEYASRDQTFDRYFGQDREMLAADRIQLNMLEQMPVFLVLLWLHAVFVSAFAATVAGAVYTALRAVYPFVMGGRLGRGVKARIMMVTFPGYAVIAWLALGLVVEAVR